MPFTPTATDPWGILQEYGQATGQSELIDEELRSGRITPDQMVAQLRGKGSIAVGERADQIRSTENWGRKILDFMGGGVGEEGLYAPPELTTDVAARKNVNAIAPDTARLFGGVGKSVVGIPANILSAAPELLSVGLEDASERVGDNVVGDVLSGAARYIHGGAQEMTKPFETGSRGLMEAGDGSLNPLVGWKNMTDAEKGQWTAEALAQNIPQLLLTYGAGKMSNFKDIVKAKSAIGKILQIAKPTGLLAPTYAQEAKEIFGGQMEEKRAGNRENVDLMTAAIMTFISSQSERAFGSTKAIGDILTGAGVKGKNIFSSILRETIKTGLGEGAIQEPFQTAIEEIGKSGWKAITDPEQLMSKTLPAMIESGVAAGISAAPVGSIHGAKDFSRAAALQTQAETENQRGLRDMQAKQRDYFVKNIPQISESLQSQPLVNLMALNTTIANDASAPTGVKESIAELISARVKEAQTAGKLLPTPDEINARAVENTRQWGKDATESSPLLGSFARIADNPSGTSDIVWHGNHITVPTVATQSPSAIRFDTLSTEQAHSTLDFLHESGFVNTRGYDALKQQLSQSPENLNRVMLNFQTVRDDLSKKTFKATKDYQASGVPGEFNRNVSDALLRGQINLFSGHVADTLPHEIAHPVWDSLPEDFKKAYTEYAKTTHEDFLNTPIGRTYTGSDNLLSYISNPQERFAVEFAEAYYVPALREHVQRQKYMGSSIGRMVLAVKDFVRKVGTMVGANPQGIAADVAIKNAKVTPEQLILVNKQYKDMAGFAKPTQKVTKAEAAGKVVSEKVEREAPQREVERLAAKDRAEAMGAAETEAVGTIAEDIEHPDYKAATKEVPAAVETDVQQVKRAAEKRAVPVMQKVIDERKRQRQAGELESETQEAIGKLGEDIERPDIKGAATPVAKETAETLVMDKRMKAMDRVIGENARLKEENSRLQDMFAAQEERVGELGKHPLVPMTENIEPQKARMEELALRQGQEAPASDVGQSLAEAQKREAKEAAEWVAEFTPEQRVKNLTDQERLFYDAFHGKGVSFSLKSNPDIPHGIVQPVRSLFSLNIRGKNEMIMVNPDLSDAVKFANMKKEYFQSLRAIYDEKGGNLFIFSPMILHNWVKEAMGWEKSGEKNPSIHLMLNDIDLANLQAGNPETSLNWIDDDKKVHSIFDNPNARVHFKQAMPNTPAKFDRKSKIQWGERNVTTGKWEDKGDVSRSMKAVSPDVTNTTVVRAIYNDINRIWNERKDVKLGSEVSNVDMSDVDTPFADNFDETKQLADLKRYEGRIVKGLTGAVNRLSKSHFWEKYLGSPEHWKHPVLQDLVSLFSDTRDRYRHTIFYHLDAVSDVEKEKLGIKNIKADKVSQALADLKYEGATDKQKAFNLEYESAQYKLLTDMIEDGDIHYVRTPGGEVNDTNAGSIEDRQEKLIAKWKEKGASDTTIETWKMMRNSLDKALDLQLDNMAKLKDLLETQPQTAQTKRMKDSLTKAMEHMNSWRGFYAPRIRNRGDWVVRAKRTVTDREGNKRVEYFRDNAQTEAGAMILAEKLHQSGWDAAQPFLSPKPPEDVYNAVKLLDVRQLLNSALERMSQSAKSEEDLAERAKLEEANIKFSEDIIESIANVMRERGYRATAIRRGEHYVSGYNVDPVARFVWYTSNTSNGMAKAEVAKQAVRLMSGEIKKSEDGSTYRTGGLNATQDREEYNTARTYISNQLRNSTFADQVVGAGKMAAAMWFLTAPKSALVNLLALVTNAPPTISHVVTQGTYSPHRVAGDISKAVADYYKSWRGDTSSLSADEVAFMQWVRENEYDAPEFTRASLGLAKSPIQTSLDRLMDKAMWFFGKTEKLNRGATLLASYRIARDQMHMRPEEARKIAAEATWKTHGKYGKATDIYLAQDTGILGRAAQMAYTFAKFPHNHLQMMKRMATKDAGMTTRDWKNFCWMLMMPMMLVGGAGVPFKDEWFKLFGAMASMFGFKGDAQKYFHDQVRKNFGENAEKFARSGLLGQAGIDVTGSLSIGTPTNINAFTMAGAAGGVFKNMIDAGHFLKTGQPGRAFETAMPTVIKNAAQAFREAEGVKTKQGYTLFTPEGKPYVPDSYETMLRALGFRSSAEAMQSSRVWEIKKENKIYDEERKDILEEIRSCITIKDGKAVVDETKKEAVMEKAKKYNNSVDKLNKSVGYMGKSSMVPKITPDTVKTQFKNAMRPRTQQMRELKTLQTKGEY